MSSTVQGVRRSTQDAVAILDAQSFQPLFVGSNPMRVSVRETSRLTTWAVEDGSSRTDHRVLDPVEINIPMLLSEDTRSLYEQLRTAYLEGRDLIVQTKVASYSSMMIYEIPREETPDQGDAIAIEVKLREIRVVTPEFGTLPPSRVSNPAQASTQNRGQQQTDEADAPTQRRASLLYRITNDDAA